MTADIRYYTIVHTFSTSIPVEMPICYCIKQILCSNHQFHFFILRSLHTVVDVSFDWLRYV